jgi:uncharacterized protein YdeI (YjbR/CyaY-like superfamily)
VTSDDHQRVEVTSRKSLRAWLLKNHQQTDSIWLVTWKKGDDRHVPYTEIVDEALCFGWIDSLPRKLDDTRTMLRLSPRKPKGAWSKVNKDKVAALEAKGLMHASGRAMVTLAKANGLWDKLNTVDALNVPDDLAKAFTKTARANFDAFPPSVRRGILEWILQAKKPETRTARIKDTADKAKDNIRANQWRQ